MGIPGQTDDSRMRDAIATILKAVLAAGKVPAIFAGNPEAARRYVAMGFRMILYTSDLALFASAAKGAVKALKAG